MTNIFFIFIESYLFKWCFFYYLKDKFINELRTNKIKTELAMMTVVQG